jgi:hypothetical protein
VDYGDIIMGLVIMGLATYGSFSAAARIAGWFRDR